MNEESPIPALEGIAIVGMAGRFPGAENLAQFWDNLTAGRETISDIPLDLIPAEENKSDPDYVPRRGQIDRPEWFDAAFFGMTPREAEVTDPQQRVFLEACHHALEHAGCDPARFPGAIGVYAGMSNNSWLQHQILPNPALRAQFGYEAAMIANEKDYLATRVAYKLNLRGPAVNVYTACSTSLVAVCQAVQALQAFACDAALAGGVSVKWPQDRGYTAQEGSIYSPDGHCRPYDADSRGTVFSNGLGVVVLKRLEDAVRDGDCVWAVIKGAALNNDGAGKVSFTAPSVEGHAEVIGLAHALAAVDPDTISYVEGHGTATPIGDPIEVAGLTRAFRLGTERKNFCGLGSLKSNTGHMDAAAGVGGLIKTVLSLHHRQLPPTLHFRKANPALHLEDSPFRVIDKAEPWTAEGHPLRAGVSSFGVGGTNAHVVLEEAPESAAEAPGRSTQVLVLSAKTATALEAMRAPLAEWLDANPDKLAAAAWTLQIGRQEFTHRLSVTARSAGEAVEALRSSATVPALARHCGAPTVFVFPGQGAQHLRMGRETYAQEPAFREAFDECSELFLKEGVDLGSLLAGEDPEQLNETRHAQPALFAVEYALAKVLLAWGFTPSAMIGHSIGEYVAATLAGVMSLTDAARLVALRGRLMWEQKRGAMLAVRLPEAEVANLLPPGLDIAAVNAPGLTVVSGPEEAITSFTKTLEAGGHSPRKLHTSHAFHSAMMDPAQAEFRAAVASTALSAPKTPYLSNVTGDFITPEDAVSPDYWTRHIRQSVRFADGVARICQDGPCVFLECGPGNALSPLIKQHPDAKECAAVSLFPPASKTGEGEHSALLSGIGKLWAAGANVDWSAFQGEARHTRVPLPGYPFERQRYCPDTVLPLGTKREGEAWLLQGAAAVTETISTGDIPLPAALPSAAASGPTVSRREHLVTVLREQFHRISGIDVHEADPATPFLDLGFDSLFLTQAGLALKKHFGLKITFRQLMEDQPSIAALAEWLDTNLPAGAFQPEAPVTASPAAVSAMSASHSATVSTALTDGSASQRLAIIEQQIAALRGSLGRGGSAEPGTGRYSVRVSSLKGSDGKKIAFGPFKPIERTKDGGLTTAQQNHLRDLIAAYTSKYAKAKEFTASHRDVFADPRAVAGFNLLWKDMVFPAVTDRSEGAYLFDTDGNRWIDVVHGFGLGFFGHRPKFVTDALHEQIDKGFEIGPTSPLAGEVALLIQEFSRQERVAFCNTGSEALMAAIRTSRTISGRDIIAMFAGGYHGIFDEVLARPLVTNGELRSIPIAPGVPESAQACILVLEYGNPESLEILKRHGGDIACVLVEPVMSRRPDVVPLEFVKELREITRESGTALVFDEVVLGFRTGPHGAQEHFGIEADLVTYGKVIGGGMPLGVICGKRKYMDALDGGAWSYGDDSMPEVGVTFFAGTFIRHPLTLAAARAVLLKLKAEGPALQKAVEEKTRDFVDRLNALFEKAGVPVKSTRFSSMWMLNADPGLKYFALLYYHLRLRGVHLWEGRPGFLSTAHTAQDVEEILSVFQASIEALQTSGFFPGGPEPDRSLREAPTTPAQREMFLASHMSGDAALACHESVSLKISGPLDTAVLTTALETLAARHDSLRATFSEDGRTMRFAKKAPLNFRRAEPVVSETELESLRAAEFLTPFDLELGPLYRFLLVPVGPERAELIFTAHHIICDGWSVGVLAHELPLLLSGGPALPDAASYGEYAMARKAEDDAGDFQEDREWWREQFRTVPAPLLLPCDGQRPVDPGYLADSAELEMPAELVAKLKTFCAAHRVTSYQALLAAWWMLIHRLSGSEDFLIGTPVAGQAAAGLTDLTGHCVQFLPLRASVDPEESALEVVRRARSLTLAAQEHGNVTLGDILETLPDLSGPDRQRFVAATFSLEPAVGAVTAGPLSITAEGNTKRRLSFDLSLYVFQGADSLKIRAAFRTELFSADTVRRWLSHYTVLLESLLENPERSVRRLGLLDEATRAAVTTGFNSAARSWPEAPCLHRWFEEIALKYPDRVAVNGSGASLTYAELNSRANRIAHYLISRGAGPDALVGLCMDRGPELIAALLGILKSGAAYLPIDLSYPAARLAFMLEDGGAEVLLTQRSLSRELPGHAGDTVFLDESEDLLAGLPDTNPRTEVTPEHMAYVIYTSGSTGKPKGCMVTHRNVSRLMLATEDWYGFNADDVWTLFHSTAFDFSVWEIWGALLYGGRLVTVPFLTSRSPDEFYQLLSAEKVTVLNQTPSAFRQLIHAEAAAPETLPLALRYVIFGGEALEMRSLEPWFDRHGDSAPLLVNMYGITETTVHVTWRPVSRQDTAGGSVIGVPIPDLQLYIVDPETLEPVPPGVPGEMLVGGDGLARGYLHREELTAERFIPDHFTGRGRLYRTGDLARFIPAARDSSKLDIEYLGRIDHQVKIRGFRIELGEIESALCSHPEIREAAVLALGDAAGEKKLHAWIIPSGERVPTAAQLREHLLKTLPDYMAPSVFMKLDRFPLTTNGKLDQRALPSPQNGAALSTVAEEDEWEPPQTETQRHIAGIWQVVTGRNHVGAKSDFFASGGTSLNALRLMQRIRQDFSVALPLGVLFKAPTLERLSAEVDSAKSGQTRPARSPMTRLQEGRGGIPLFLLHGGEGGAMIYRSLLDDLSPENPVYVIESPSLYEDDWLISQPGVEECGRRYAELIRRAAGGGPFIVGGYSFGGVVAYDVACRMSDGGGGPEALILFDTENPADGPRERTLTERIAANWRMGGDRLGGRIKHLGGRIGSGLVRKIKADSETTLARKALEEGTAFTDAGRLVQIRVTHIDALERYTPRPYEGRVLLLRSEAVSDKYDRTEDYNWRTVVPQLEIVRIPGDHLELFDPPYAAPLAAKLRAWLKTVRPESSGA